MKKILNTTQKQDAIIHKVADKYGVDAYGVSIYEDDLDGRPFYMLQDADSKEYFVGEYDTIKNVLIASILDKCEWDIDNYLFPRVFSRSYIDDALTLHTEQRPFRKAYLSEIGDIIREKKRTPDSKYNNKLVRRLVELGIITNDDLEEHNGKLYPIDGFDMRSALRKYTELNEREDGDYALWYLDNYGEREFMKLARTTHAVDFEKIVNLAVDSNNENKILKRLPQIQKLPDDTLFVYTEE